VIVYAGVTAMRQPDELIRRGAIDVISDRQRLLSRVLNVLGRTEEPTTTCTGKRLVGLRVNPDAQCGQRRQSGRDEVYVRPFPDVDTGGWQVSMSGGVGRCGRATAGSCSSATARR
jgi:hypothetical protein